MKPRERVRASLKYQKPDKLPVDFGSTNITTIHVGAYKNLIKKLGITQDKIGMIDNAQQLAMPCEEVLKLFQVDTRPVKLRHGKSKTKIVNENEFIDDWGLVWKRPQNGLYFDSSNAPLANAESVEEILSYPWPETDVLADNGGIKEEAKALYENTGYALIGSFGSSIYMRAQLMRGYEQLFVDMAFNTDIFEALLDRILEIRIKLAGMLLDEAGEYLDVVELADDIPGQQGPLFNPEIYRKLIKPRTKALIDSIKSKHRHIKTLYHCCGSASQFIEDFIEIGIDALNPVQVSAVDMDSKMLYKRFGGRITFWGGIDQQGVLVKGSPEDVRKETRKRIEDFGSHGGYFPFSTHNIQADVSADNIIAMFETINEFKYG